MLRCGYDEVVLKGAMCQAEWSKGLRGSGS